VRRLFLALPLCACATYRVLPVPPPPAGFSALAVQYEQTRFFLFHSIKDDTVFERIFAGPGVLIATVLQPDTGVYASSDGGLDWSFARLPADDEDPRVFREVLFGEQRIVARSASRLWQSDDGGRSWTATPLPGGVDAAALASDGTIYAAGQGRIFVSSGQGWKALSVQGAPPDWRARSIAVDPAQPRTVYLSLRSSQADLLARVSALLDWGSDEALAALKLVDSRDPAAREYSFGDGAVYATNDGGTLWRKTGLSMDAWLVARDGVIHAVAADPLLQAAALARRYSDLAAVLGRQLHGDRADPASLRAACAWPGRERLLAGPLGAAVVFRAEAGAWARVVDPAPALLAALRPAVEERRIVTERRPPPRPAMSQTYIPLGRGPPRIPPTGPTPAPRRGPGRALAAETLLSLLDPVRLLSRFNAGLPLTGVAGDYAYVPAENFWNELVEAMAKESAELGEISLGPGAPRSPVFSFLHSADGAWKDVPETPSRGYPAGIAAAPGQVFLVISGRVVRYVP
jgi:hypothetical protein